MPVPATISRGQDQKRSGLNKSYVREWDAELYMYMYVRRAATAVSRLRKGVTDFSIELQVPSNQACTTGPQKAIEPQISLWKMCFNRACHKCQEHEQM